MQEQEEMEIHDFIHEDELEEAESVDEAVVIVA